MTLVAAFRCKDNAVLLCADRQDDNGIAKRPVDKIFEETGLPDCQIFIAGSGPTTAVLDSWQEIHSRLNEAAHVQKIDVVRNHRPIIEAALKTIHSKHKADLTWWNPLGLLVVVVPRKPNSIPILYRSDRSTLVPEGEYAAAGTGKILLDYFAGRLYKHGLPNIPLLVLVAFILREADMSVSGVGLGNDMILICPNGLRKYLHTDSIKEIQAGIPSLADAIQSYWTEHVKAPQWLKDYAACSESTE